MICRADTVGVFQIESRAQMSMLPRLRPREFYDLVIEVAIVRPGPIQGGMVHPYLRRRNGEEPVTYPNEAIREVLHKTLGVPLFQEQAMRLAVVAAGFTPGEADQLRRAMGAWRRGGDIARFRTKLIDGMTARGLSAEFAERCFQQIRGFGEYGFPESHAASFALLVYVSAWLKRYHPAAFCASIINAQPMGFYQPAQLVRDAREHGVTVLPPDVNWSGYDCRLEEEATKRRSDEATEGKEEATEMDRGIKGSRDRGIEVPEPWHSCRGRRAASPAGCHAFTAQPGKRAAAPPSGVGSAVRTDRSSVCHGSVSRAPDADPSTWGLDDPAVRLGMRLVKGISESQVRGIEDARRERPFTSVHDLARRSGAARSTLARLAAADAMRSLGLNRHEALWQVLALGDDPPLLDGHEPQEEPTHLPDLSLKESVYADYHRIGLSLTAHPMSLIRDRLSGMNIQPSRALQHTRQGQWIRVAGLVLIRQRPSTALGIIFCTLEDETGVANLVIRPPIYQKYRCAARGAVALIAEGRVERQNEVVHLQCTRLQDLSAALSDLASTSRDFR